MAYNLNYNPGTEYDRDMKHRKTLVVFIVVLVIAAIIVLVYFGFRNLEKNPGRRALTEEERQALVQATTATGSSTLSQKEEATLLKGMSGSSGTSSSSISPEQKNNLIKAMSQ